jgi:hypothetical protein
MPNKMSLPAVVGIALALVVISAPAHAQATRTWVSGVGDDANPCSRTAPCRTFAGAFSKTFINGEIDCIDPGGYGTLTVTKSITIDCTGTFGSVLASGTNGFDISIAVNANDPFRTVRLRGLSINGTGASGSVGTRTGLKGVSITNAAVVILEDLVISDFSQQGVSDTRSPGGKLFIRNSVIRNNTSTGIAAGATATNNVSLENVYSINNGFGVAAATGNNVSITRSVFSGNTTAGIESDSGGQIGLDDSLVSANATGLLNSGTMSISNSSISSNTTGITGATTSFGDNRIFDNGAAGTVPTLGAASSDHSQQ